MVVTDNPDFARTIRMLRDWGQEKKYHHVLRGYNYRMEGFQGAILRVKLRHLETWTEARRAHAARYDELLAGTAVETPAAAPRARHVYYVYTVRSAQRDALQEALSAQGVQTGIHYPTPVHLQEAYADPAFQRGDFPHAERAASQVLSLPMFAELTDAQIEAVSAAVRQASGQ
jgi:dTDP-4-amino-4,6-dideoxygalactose transaminase